MDKKDEAIHFCIGILEGLSSGNLKKSSKMIDLGIKGIRELVELSDSAKNGVGNTDHYTKKCKDAQEPENGDLEAEINRYLSTWSTSKDNGIVFCEKMARHFAAWQKQQMMKDADDYIVDDDNTIKRFYDTGGVVGKPIIFGSTPDSINVGDHVKVIVIKEE